MVEDKYVGLALAITSSLAIGKAAPYYDTLQAALTMTTGSSFVITKKGLNQTSERHGFEGDGFKYLRNPVWWSGTLTSQS